MSLFLIITQQIALENIAVKIKKWYNFVIYRKQEVRTMGLYELFEDLEKIDRKITEKNEKERRISCNVCGDMFSYADRIELSNGICCPNCKNKISPWFDKELQFTDVVDLKNHLTYRDKNFTELFDFNPTIEIGNELKILIDERMKKFVIASEDYDYKEKNSDLIPLTSVTSCRHRVVESKDEIFFRDALGRTGRFTPRAFNYSYDFVINIETNIPFMSKMEFKINRCRVGSDNPTTIQVSKENFTNKIKDFFKMERMYPGKIDNSKDVKNSPEYKTYEHYAEKMCEAILQGKENAHNRYYDKSKYIICQWCGSKIDINASTCPHCGGVNK